MTAWYLLPMIIRRAFKRRSKTSQKLSEKSFTIEKFEGGFWSNDLFLKILGMGVLGVFNVKLRADRKITRSTADWYARGYLLVFIQTNHLFKVDFTNKSSINFHSAVSIQIKFKIIEVTLT